MKKPFQLHLAKRRGELTAKEHKFTSFPVDPAKIAAMNDILVQPKPDTEEGVSGMLLRHGDTFGIMYATHLKNEGFERFSIAHELGHYFLDGHIDHVLPKEGFHASRAGFVTADVYELEADHFAAGLLMPEHLFRRTIGQTSPGLIAIEYMRGKCQTSMEATAIRYAELSEDPVTVILSTGKTIDYCCMSESMKSLPGLSWLRKGSSVPPNTATSAINSDKQRVLSAGREVREIDLLDWLGGDRSIAAIEEVVGLGRYGKTLTILHCPDVVDERYADETVDEEDEGDLVDRWTPRFHR